MCHPEAPTAVRRRGWAYRGPGRGSGHFRALCGNGTRAPHRDGTRASGTLWSDCSDRPNPRIICQLLVVWIHCCVNMGPGIHLHSVNFHTPCRMSGKKSTCHTGEPLLKTIWSTQSSSPHPRWAPSSLELLQPPPPEGCRCPLTPQQEPRVPKLQAARGEGWLLRSAGSARPLLSSGPAPGHCSLLCCLENPDI